LFVWSRSCSSEVTCLSPSTSFVPFLPQSPRVTRRGLQPCGRRISDPAVFPPFLATPMSPTNVICLVSSTSPLPQFFSSPPNSRIFSHSVLVCLGHVDQLDPPQTPGGIPSQTQRPCPPEMCFLWPSPNPRAPRRVYPNPSPLRVDFVPPLILPQRFPARTFPSGQRSSPFPLFLNAVYENDSPATFNVFPPLSATVGRALQTFSNRPMSHTVLSGLSEDFPPSPRRNGFLPPSPGQVVQRHWSLDFRFFPLPSFSISGYLSFPCFVCF